MASHEQNIKRHIPGTLSHPPKTALSRLQQMDKEWINSRPTTSIVIVDTRVANGAPKPKTFDIFMPFGIPEFLSQAEIDGIKYISSLPNPHQEIVWLDIAMEEALGMDIFDSRNGLVGDEEDGLERKLSITVVEKIFERWAENVVNQHEEVALLPKPADLRYSHSAEKRFVRFLLTFELRVAISNMCEL
jgi:hypothetical protein